MRKPFIIAAKSILALLSVAGMGLLMAECWLIWHFEYGIGLPDADKLATVSATGPVCSAGDRRTYIPLSEIPLLVRQAAIAYEEPDFYERLSTNPFIERVIASLFNRPLRPTNISASVTRCVMSLSPDCCEGPSLDRHIGHIVLLGRIAKALSHDRILEIYLNETYLGRGSYGVGAASMAYFNKPLRLLSIDEIAFIAALPRMPTLPNRRIDLARDRRNAVIDRMLQASVINDAEAASARERPLQFHEALPDDTQQRKL